MAPLVVFGLEFRLSDRQQTDHRVDVLVEFGTVVQQTEPWGLSEQFAKVVESVFVVGVGVRTE